jgi:hypothetical protein
MLGWKVLDIAANIPPKENLLSFVGPELSDRLGVVILIKILNVSFRDAR